MNSLIDVKVQNIKNKNRIARNNIHSVQNGTFNDEKNTIISSILLSNDCFMKQKLQKSIS